MLEMVRSVALAEHPGYLIYEDGRIKGPRGRWLKPIERPSGYLFIRRWNGTKRINLSIHALVCTAFNGPKPSPLHQVRHLNGIKTDNRAENLRWGTVAENAHDRILHGTSPKGTANRQAKIGPSTVQEIRSLYATGRYRQVDLAKRFGLGQSHISRIVRRENWAA